MTEGRRSPLFVSGMQRSGTTLVQKLLDQQTALTLLSQPFPLLFVDAKREFLSRLGHAAAPYPLGHLFGEQRYHAGEFAQFLRHWAPDRERVRSLFDEMKTFSGQYTRFADPIVAAATDALPAVDFADTVGVLYQRLCAIPEASLYGGKETICEEFFPYLLECGFYCLLVLRDPRDTVASLNCGKGPEHGGSIKPTLLNVRNWRKSVAFGLELERHPRFLAVRYEDVVRHPEHSIRRIVEWLGFAADPVNPGRITDSSGEVWRGNSSHAQYDGVHHGSIGAWRRLMPERASTFIEATCLPELRLLGYDSGLSGADAVEVIRTFEEPWQITRAGVDEDRMNAANVDMEIERLQLLEQEWSDASRALTLFESAHRRLREVL